MIPNKQKRKTKIPLQDNIDKGSEGKSFMQIKNTKNNSLIYSMNAHIPISKEINNRQPLPAQEQQPQININNLNLQSKYLIDLKELESKYIDDNILIHEGDIENTPEFMSKLYHDLQMKHPRIIINGQAQKISCCIRTGNYCCCKCCRSKSTIEAFGIGQMIYFKLMKALIIALFLITLINLPIYWVYYNSHHEKIPYSYTDLLFKTTIGNIGSTMYNCRSFPIDFTASAQVFEFNCNTMNISAIVAFGTAVDDDMERKNNQNCFDYMSISSIKIDPSCNLSNDFNERIINDCNGKTQCTITYDMRTLKTKCLQSSPNESLSKLYLGYSCFDSYIGLGYQDYKMQRNYFGYFIVVIDFLGITILLITLNIVNYFYKKDLMQYKENNIFIQHYTLYCDNLTVKQENLNEEIGDLIAHFNKILMTNEGKKHTNLASFEASSFNNNKDEKDNSRSQYCNYNKEMKKAMNEKNNVNLYEIVYPRLTCEKLDDVKKLHKLQNQLHKKEIKNIINGSDRIDNHIKDLNVNSGRSNERDIIRLPNCSVKITKSLDILKLEEKIRQIKAKINKDTEVMQIKEFYLTFRNQQIANYIQSKYQLSKGKRCCLICFCKKSSIDYLYYKSKWLKLTYTKDEPTNLKWENMTYSHCKRCLRKTFSIFIAILIMVITLIVILLGKSFQAEMTEEFNTTIDCSYLKGIVETDIEIECLDTTIPKNQRFKTYCFCNNKMSLIDVFTNELKEYTIKGTNIKPCHNFIESYLKYNAMNIGIIIAIPVVNTIVMTIFKVLTTFERNKTMSEDMRSNMWKIFIITFINTGILLIIINVRIDKVLEKIPTFPFFAGEFKDFDPGWYNRVGVVILFSMLLDIFTPHATSMLIVLLRCMIKCCDSGCSNGKTTKKLTKNEYFETYTGPVFEIASRYASLLSSFFVVMLFAPGIPFLYCFFFLNLLLTYFVDKLLIITFYRNPPKYDLGIITSFLFYSFFAILIHFLFAIWIYGNPYLLVDNNPKRLKEVKDFFDNFFTTNIPILQNIIGRLTLGHNIILISGFLFIVVVIIIRALIGLLRLICGCGNNGEKKENETENKKNVELGLAISLRDLHRSYVIKQLEYNQLEKMSGNETNSIKVQKKNLQKGMNYLKMFIVYKIQAIKMIKCPNLIDNFDEEIKKITDLFALENKCIIEGDMSYNIVFIPEFEAVAYYDYIKKLK